MSNKKEKEIMEKPGNVKITRFAEIITVPKIDLSEAIARANLEQNKREKFAQILTIYRKDI